MIATRATFSCCGAPATPDALKGHKCLGRGVAPGVSAPKSSRATSGVGAHPAPSRPGRAAEEALADALGGPFIVVPFRAWIRACQVGPNVIVREYEWGIGLEPRRRYRCDFLHIATGTMIEVEGGAHGIQRQRRGDILRAQLAEAAGYRIVRVLPEQVRDGSAVEVVRRALPAREA